MTATIAPQPSPEVGGDAAAEGGQPLPAFHVRAVLLVAAGFVALQIGVAARYGIHRDELYFLACARHLAWGYVDQPPLVPAVAWLAKATVGGSAVGLRVLPAVAGGATVVVSALMARELRGGRAAQTLAALAAATAPELLAMFHLLSTAAFDAFFWSVITFLFLRLLRTGDQRLLVAIGAVTGVAFLNKLNVGFLIAALVVCVWCGPSRRFLASRYTFAGATLAVALFSPDLAWNATHHWAQLAMLKSLHQENSGLGASIAFIPSQFIVVGPVLIFLWVGGLRRLLKDRAGRPLALAYLALLVYFALAGAKPYYLAGMYYVLFAAGGVWAEQRLAAGHKPGRVRGWTALLVAGALIGLRLSLPVLPVSTLPRGAWEGQINKDLSATYAWPYFVRQVAALARQLPPQQRSRLVIYTGDYGAAGAIDLYGSRYQLPAAISGHNNYWWWGPGRAPDDSTTIAVNLPRSYLETIFAKVVLVGTVQTPDGAWTEERGDQIFLCTGQTEAWTTAWPTARHYG